MPSVFERAGNLCTATTLDSRQIQCLLPVCATPRSTNDNSKLLGIASVVPVSKAKWSDQRTVYPVRDGVECQADFQSVTTVQR